jgi:hypothetical protein
MPWRCSEFTRVRVVPRIAASWPAGSIGDVVRGAVPHRVVLAAGRAMIEAAGSLLQLRFQRAAQRDVEFLETAADAQQRHFQRAAAQDEVEREVVTHRVIGFVGGARGIAIARRVHVRHRAGQQHAIDLGEHRVEIQHVGHGRDHERHAGRRHPPPRAGTCRRPNGATGRRA